MPRSSAARASATSAWSPPTRRRRTGSRHRRNSRSRRSAPSTSSRGSNGSVEQIRQLPTGGDDPRVLGAGDLEVLEQARAHAVAAVLVERDEEVEEARERILEVTARDVEVGDIELRVEVLGRVGGRGADLRRG